VLGITVMAGFMLSLGSLQAGMMGGGGEGDPGRDPARPPPAARNSTSFNSPAAPWIIGAVSIPVAILTFILLGFMAFHGYLSISGTTTKAVLRARRQRGEPAATPAEASEADVESAPESLALLADDGSKLSGVVAWELAGPATSKPCLPSLVSPREIMC
jgi:hypothetical protein